MRLIISILAILAWIFVPGMTRSTARLAVKGLRSQTLRRGVHGKRPNPEHKARMRAQGIAGSLRRQAKVAASKATRLAQSERDKASYLAKIVDIMEDLVSSIRKEADLRIKVRNAFAMEGERRAAYYAQSSLRIQAAIGRDRLADGSLTTEGEIRRLDRKSNLITHKEVRRHAAKKAAPRFRWTRSQLAKLAADRKVWRLAAAGLAGVPVVSRILSNSEADRLERAVDFGSARIKAIEIANAKQEKTKAANAAWYFSNVEDYLVA